MWNKLFAVGYLNGYRRFISYSYSSNYHKGESIEISSFYFHWTKQSLDAKPKMVVIVFEITTDNVYRIPSVATEAITYW